MVPIKKLLLSFLILILLSCSVLAVDFVPQGNINGKNIYKIYGFIDINGTRLFQNGNQVLDTSSPIIATDATVWIGMSAINTTTMQNQTGTLGVKMSYLDGIYAKIIDLASYYTKTEVNSLDDAQNITINTKLTATDQRYNETSVISQKEADRIGNDSAINNSLNAEITARQSTGNWTADKSSYATTTSLSSVGNWSLDKSAYQIWTTTKSYIDSVGNWTSDKVNYVTTTTFNTIGNWSLDKSSYQIWTTTKAYIDSVGNWTADKPNYATTALLTTEQNNRISNDSTKALVGASAACTYGIANVTTSNSSVPTVTCAAQQGNLNSGGTLTTSNICQYDGTGIDCNLVQDGSGDCAAGAVCEGGHTHSTYLTTEVDGSITNELQNIFQTIDAPSGTDPVAGNTTSILQFIAGAGITITGDSAADTITFVSTATGTGNGNVTGYGTASKLAKFYNGTEVRDSSISDNGTDVGIGEGVTAKFSNVSNWLYIDTTTNSQATGINVSNNVSAKDYMLDGILLTPTFTELNYVDGVTSAIQTQLGTKAPTASPTFTGTAVFDGANFTGIVWINNINSTNITGYSAATSFIENGAYLTNKYLKNGSTLTSANVCQFDGTGVDCDLPKDATGDCAAGSVCTGGHEHTGYLPLSGGTMTGGLSLTTKNITAINCIVFDSGAKIGSCG